jgi:hypothetical protein
MRIGRVMISLLEAKGCSRLPFNFSTRIEASKSECDGSSRFSSRVVDSSNLRFRGREVRIVNSNRGRGGVDMSATRLLGLIAIAGLAGFVIWSAFLRPPAPPNQMDGTDEELTADPPPPDPRTSFPTAFRNVRPGVKYVGDASCAECHRAIDESYHAHPMGRSAAFVSSTSSIEKMDPGSQPSFSVGKHGLRVEKTPGGFVHHVSASDSAGQALPEYSIRAELAIGSGTRGRSYLAVQSGAVWQTPISWFTSSNRWDLSPGFDLGNGGRRAITAECLFCHVDRVEPIRGSVNRYREPLLPTQPSIGCERCHGPGELHVAERRLDRPAGGAVDSSIVNPKHLSPELQSAICAQCHLQGQQRVARRGREFDEFRPGLPLEQFMTVFVRHPNLVDWHRSVGQFEQLERSQCRIASRGRLVCTSCHDPHSKPSAERKDAHFRARCQTCHESGSKACSAPISERRSQSDSCIACHMPQTGSSNIAHASVTDHRILRRPTPLPPPSGLIPGESPLTRFSTGPHVPGDAELERDLGIALARIMGQSRDATIRESANETLERSLRSWRGDADAWFASSLIRRAGGDGAGASRAAANALRLEPDSAAALAFAAELALAARQFTEAERLATKLIALAPTNVEPLAIRALALGGQVNWVKAEQDCRAALAIHPLHPRVRLAFAVCRHHLGDADGGRREAATAAGLCTDARTRQSFEEWYRTQTR